MASLIEELINVLEEENEEYEQLVDLSKKKTLIIVNGDLKSLQEIMDEEQVHLDRIINLENKRINTVDDIATVLNRDSQILTVREIIKLLRGQEKEQQQLSMIHDKLKRTLEDMETINDINKNLIVESMEMIDFDINLINSLNQMPELGNYSRNASYDGCASYPRLGFDTKQ